MAYAFEGYIINEFRDTTVTVDGQTVDGLTLTEAAFNIPRYPFDSYGALDTPIKVFCLSWQLKPQPPVQAFMYTG
jgi:hypothetical protein